MFWDRRGWRLGGVLLFALWVVACDEDSGADVEAEPPAPAAPCAAPDPSFDGVYGVTFSADGQQTAVGAGRKRGGKKTNEKIQF